MLEWWCMLSSYAIISECYHLRVRMFYPLCFYSIRLLESCDPIGPIFMRVAGRRIDIYVLCLAWTFLIGISGGLHLSAWLPREASMSWNFAVMYTRPLIYPCFIRSVHPFIGSRVSRLGEYLCVLRDDWLELFSIGISGGTRAPQHNCVHNLTFCLDIYETPSIWTVQQSEMSNPPSYPTLSNGWMPLWLL